MTFTMELGRCKLEAEGKIIYKLMSFKWLRIIITSSKHLTLEVEILMKKMWISSYCDVLQRNINM